MIKSKMMVLLGTLAISGAGLVAHWNFDDCTAKDVSGNGHAVFTKNWSIVANFKRTGYNSAWDAIFSNTWDTPDAPVMTFQNIGTNFLGMNRVGVEGVDADGAFTNSASISTSGFLLS